MQVRHSAASACRYPCICRHHLRQRHVAQDLDLFTPDEAEVNPLADAAARALHADRPT